MPFDPESLPLNLSELSVASAYLEKSDELVWSKVWENDSAKALWGDVAFNDDLTFKLFLLETSNKGVPKNFKHRFEGGMQTCQFFVAPYHRGLLVQFYLDNEPERNDDWTSLMPTSDVGQENAQESIYQHAIETANIGVIDLDVSSQRAHYNDKFYKLCSLSYSALGNEFSDFLARLHPDDVNMFEEAMDSHIKLHWPFKAECRFRTGANEYIWLLIRGSCFDKVSGGNAAQFIMSVQDISERKWFEQLVASREQLISQILDSLPISIYVKDDKGIYRFFSRQAALETGLNRSKVLGQTDFELYPIEKARKYTRHDAEVAQMNCISIMEEKVKTGQDGEHAPVWFLRGKGPIKVKVEDREQMWLLGFSVDITHQKMVEDNLIQAKDAAEASARAKSDFLSVMSHEIRTPLNSVIGGAQLLMGEALGEDQRKHVELIHHAGGHLLNLINDILDFSKMDAGKLDLEKEVIDVVKVCEVALEMNKMTAEDKHLSLALSFDDSLPRYRFGDIARLRQVLLNLLTNAVKFTEQGSVTLRVEPGHSEQALVFKVEDTGIGISEAGIPRLFNEFAQADASITRKYGGTGLGLAICRKIVEAMDGKIGVDSQVGRGSTFWFEIELEVAPTPKENDIRLTSVSTEDEHDQIPLRILVAEDNPTNQILIKAILKKLCHQITLVSNGREALTALQSEATFDLVLMDMQMPEMDGVEATKQIRKLGDPQRSAIPVIALTANASEEAREEVMAAGMNDFLTKPIDIQALKTKLAYWSDAAHTSLH